MTKIARRKKDGALVGTAGVLAIGQAFERWFLNGEKGDMPNMCPKDGDHARGLVITHAGKIKLYSEYGPTEIETSRFAVGSGDTYATAAMACGKTAKEAVEIASQFDNGTGSEVDTLELG